MNEHLASWNDGPAQAAIVDFVTRVTTEVGPHHVPPAERPPMRRTTTATRAT